MVETQNIFAVYCNKCGREMSRVRYQIQKNYTKHLLGYCPHCGPRFLPFREGLPIPVVESRQKKTADKQAKLFF